MHNRRDCIILDRCMADAIHVEITTRVFTSLPVLGKLYKNIDKSESLIQFFGSPHHVNDSLLLMFHWDRLTHDLRSKMVFLKDANKDFREAADHLYQTIRAPNPHKGLGSIQIKTEADFIKAIDLAIEMERAITK